MALLTGEKTKRPLQLSALQAMWGLRVSQQGTCSKTFFFFFFSPPIGIIAFFFFYWPLLTLIKGIQFPSVAWWYSVPDTSGSVMSSEERSCWMQRKEASRSLSACLQSWRETFKHSFVAAAHRCGARVWIWLWLLCRALTAHPHTPALGEQGDVVRNLLLEGHRSGTATLSSRTPSQTLIRRPDRFLSRPAAVSSSCCLCWRSSCSCVWMSLFLCLPLLLHICQEDVSRCLWITRHQTVASFLKLIGDALAALN